MIEFLPPNVTSRHNPLDQGIIQATKAHYREELANTLVQCIDNWHELQRQAKSMADGTAGIKFGCKAHIGDAAELSIRAWKSVTQECIVNCTLKAELLGTTQYDELISLSGKKSKPDATSSTPEIAAAIDSICKLMERSLQLPTEAMRFISDGGVILDPRQRCQYAATELEEVVQEWICVEDDEDIALEQVEEHLSVTASASASAAEVLT